MTFFAEIGTLFSGMSTAVVICAILGLVFIGVEIFEPGFGIFGAVGGTLSVVAIILRAIEGDGNAIAQIFIMIFLDSVIVLGIFLLMIFLSKRNWIQRSQLMHTGTAVDVELSKGTEDYSTLLEKEGTAMTALRPTGKAEINGQVYDVIADGFFIQSDEEVKVVQIEGVKIVVARAN
ncbi:MAG: NfeD family protein [Bacillota bacterium]